MSDPVDPPRKQKRAERSGPDVINPNKPNTTIELETADLVSLATGGLVEAKPDKTRAGTPIQNPKIIVDAFYGYSAISCLADWILGIIPVFLVWNLQMNKRTKLSVAAILAVGAM